MRQTFPSFYPFFACTASTCSDNCCIGWEIDIDSRTAGRYRSLSQSDSPDQPFQPEDFLREIRQRLCHQIQSGADPIRDHDAGC